MFVAAARHPGEKTCRVELWTDAGGRQRRGVQILLLVGATRRRNDFSLDNPTVPFNRQRGSAGPLAPPRDLSRCNPPARCNATSRAAEHSDVLRRRVAAGAPNRTGITTPHSGIATMPLFRTSRGRPLPLGP